MKILNETTVFQPKTIEVLVETQEEYYALVKFVTDKSNADGWISNIGNSTRRWPEGYGIQKDTEIEIETRKGIFTKATADNCRSMWTETDKHFDDIIRFRIIK
jgi:hypothetical protein